MQQETAISPVVGVIPSPAEVHAVAHAPAAGVDAHDHAHEVGQPVAYTEANSKLAMWMFLISEVMFFTVLVAAYILVRFSHSEEHAELNVPLTSLNTFLLLMSSFTVVRALASVERNDQRRLQRSLALTILLGGIFYALMLVEYSELGSHGITINSGPFGFAFFVLTGTHGLHVLIGLIWAVLVFNKSLKGAYTANNHWGLEFFGLYWHFVDVVWIFIFTIVYLL